MNLAERHQMRANLTPVFPVQVKPARPGVYLVALAHTPNGAPRHFSFWNGARWGVASRSIRGALGFKDHKSLTQKRRWQGIIRH